MSEIQLEWYAGYMIAQPNSPAVNHFQIFSFSTEDQYKLFSMLENEPEVVLALLQMARDIPLNVNLCINFLDLVDKIRRGFKLQHADLNATLLRNIYQTMEITGWSFGNCLRELAYFARQIDANTAYLMADLLDGQINIDEANLSLKMNDKFPQHTAALYDEI